jgi:hypothetical protein
LLTFCTKTVDVLLSSTFRHSAFCDSTFCICTTLIPITNNYVGESIKQKIRNLKFCGHQKRQLNTDNELTFFVKYCLCLLFFVILYCKKYILYNSLTPPPILILAYCCGKELILLILLYLHLENTFLSFSPSNPFFCFLYTFTSLPPSLLCAQLPLHLFIFYVLFTFSFSSSFASSVRSTSFDFLF